MNFNQSPWENPMWLRKKSPTQVTCDAESEKVPGASMIKLASTAYKDEVQTGFLFIILCVVLDFDYLYNPYI